MVCASRPPQTDPNMIAYLEGLFKRNLRGERRVLHVATAESRIEHPSTSNRRLGPMLAGRLPRLRGILAISSHAAGILAVVEAAQGQDGRRSGQPTASSCGSGPDRRRPAETARPALRARHYSPPGPIRESGWTVLVVRRRSPAFPAALPRPPVQPMRAQAPPTALLIPLPIPA